MQGIRAIIIDDEKPAVDVITELCRQLAADVCVEGTATDGLQASQLISKTKPELVFLDVEMPLKNGVQVMTDFKTRDFEIIFTTGSASHALDALKLEAADYLLKPIDPAEFITAIEKVRKKISLKQKEKADRRIQLNTGKGIIYLEEKNIISVTGLGSYAHIITSDSAEKILVSKSIGSIQRQLSDRFYRCHNSRLINIDFVKRFVRKDGNFIILKNGTAVEVSRRNTEGLLQKLGMKACQI